MVELLTLMYRIEQAGESVGFMRVPAHVGIEGNELADGAAKRALRREDVDVKVRLGLTECRSIIKKNIMAVWQGEWDRERGGITTACRIESQGASVFWERKGGIQS
jgi:hypothetical protein